MAETRCPEHTDGPAFRGCEGYRCDRDADDGHTLHVAPIDATGSRLAWGEPTPDELAARGGWHRGEWPLTGRPVECRATDGAARAALAPRTRSTTDD